ncbi:transporter [Desulfovibrio sp. OttesenSCG-928-C14]|nr:transporter [Desulfovibrio sp. OttesenSCG-928-C14]
MMRKFSLTLVLCGALLLSASIALAGGGHYGVSGEGYRVGSLPPEGNLYKMYNIYYNSGSYRDDNGDKVKGTNNVDSFTQMHRFLINTNQKLFGANWFVNIAVPLKWTRMSGSMTGRGDRDRWGLGDVAFSPFLLGWNFEKFDLIADVLLYVPVGDYDKKRAESTGSGFWSILPSIGGTFYFDDAKSANFSTVLRYEFNTTKRSTEQRFGDNVVWEWALGKTFSNNIDLALTGGSVWQVTDSHGFGAANNNYSRKHIIGPEIGYTVPEWAMNFNLRCLKEYGVRNGTDGYMTTFSIVKMF